MNKLLLSFDDEEKMDEYYYTIDCNLERFHEFSFCIDKSDKFKDIINDEGRFNTSIGLTMSSIDLVYDDNPEELKLYHDNKITYEDFINSDFSIQLFGELDDIIKFIKDNRLLDTKKRIIINKKGYIGLDDRNLLKFIENELNDISNIYIFAEGNLDPVKIDEYNKTLDIVDSIVEEVKTLKLSPLEQLLYLYDKVRDRYYVLEESDEALRTSRDLTLTLLGDKIVCEGFANIYNAVALKLGFKSRTTILNIPGAIGGHERNLVYVDDSKYKYRGVIFIDPTWDCKTGENNNHFNSYKYFGLTFNEFIKENSMHELVSEYDSLAKASIEMRRNKKTFKEISYDGKRIINKIYKIINDEHMVDPDVLFRSQFLNIIDDEKNEEYTEKAFNIFDLFTRKLSGLRFLYLLYNVRRKEYYINPEKFPLDRDKLSEIMHISRPSAFSEDAESNILLELKNGRFDPIDYKIDNSGINNDIPKVRLAKTLRNVLDKKREDF